MLRQTFWPLSRIFGASRPERLHAVFRRGSIAPAIIDGAAAARPAAAAGGRAERHDVHGRLVLRAAAGALRLERRAGARPRRRARSAVHARGRLPDRRQRHLRLPVRLRLRPGQHERRGVPGLLQRRAGRHAAGLCAGAPRGLVRLSDGAGRQLRRGLVRESGAGAADPRGAAVRGAGVRAGGRDDARHGRRRRHQLAGRRPGPVTAAQPHRLRGARVLRILRPVAGDAAQRRGASEWHRDAGGHAQPRKQLPGLPQLGRPDARAQHRADARPGGRADLRDARRLLQLRVRALQRPQHAARPAGDAARHRPAQRLRDLRPARRRPALLPTAGACRGPRSRQRQRGAHAHLGSLGAGGG